MAIIQGINGAGGVSKGLAEQFSNVVGFEPDWYRYLDDADDQTRGIGVADLERTGAATRVEMVDGSLSVECNAANEKLTSVAFTSLDGDSFLFGIVFECHGDGVAGIFHFGEDAAGLPLTEGIDVYYETNVLSIEASDGVETTGVLAADTIGYNFDLEPSIQTPTSPILLLVFLSRNDSQLYVNTYSPSTEGFTSAVAADAKTADISLFGNITTGNFILGNRAAMTATVRLKKAFYKLNPAGFSVNQLDDIARGFGFLS
jgi:hypothetical protein